MKLSTKLVITVCTGILGLVAVAAVGLLQISRIHETTVNFSSYYYPSRVILADASLALERLRGIALQAVVDSTGNFPLEPLDNEFAKNRSELFVLLKKYQETMIDEESERALFKAAELLISKAVDDLYLITRVAHMRDVTTAAEYWQQADESVAAAVDALRKDAQENDLLEAKGRKDSDDAYASALFYALTTLGIVILLMSVSAWWSYKSLVNPIRALEAKLDDISLSLDLRKRIDLGASDEMRSATEAINRLLEKAHGGLAEMSEKRDLATFAATHDLLTGLPNRVLAFERLKDAISHARLAGKQVAFMFIDLDGFKVVNDTMGHDAGDFVLKQVGERLKQSIREHDTVARLGGDEFLAIVGGLSNRDVASHIAAKIIDALSVPMDYQGEPLQIGGSIGIAMYPEHGDSVESMMQAADAAMYQIKRSGKNAYKFAVPI